jgi:hypothetical protein
MNNEKTMSIFRTEKDKKEFVRLFREMTMSGVINEDVAVEKIIRNNQHLFHQQTAAEHTKSFNDAMNAAIRARARQSNRLSIDIFRRPADKQKPA